MDIEFEHTIRGFPVTVLARNFQSDPSVGIELGPDELWAETEDGAQVELTDEEYEQLSEITTESYLTQISDDPY